MRLGFAAVALVSAFAGGCDDGRPRLGDAGRAGDAGEVECTFDAECDDAVSCTVDQCILGACSSRPDMSLCRGGATCDPVRDCVTRTVCASDVDCIDDDACTTSERCDDGTRICQNRILDGDRDGDPPLVCGGGDCDDGNRSLSSRYPEICDGGDNDCDGTVDEGSAAELCGSSLLVCRDGRCRCPGASQELCGIDTCVDVLTDSRNCGMCEWTCGSGTCVGGRCECSVGLTLCPGPIGADGCVDTRTDRSNCGGCGRSCSPRSECVGGSCTECGGIGQPCCYGSSCTATGTSCIGGRCALPDRGTCDDPIERLTADVLPRCSATTRECVMACSTGSCALACLDADTTPAAGGLTCRTCVNYAANWCTDSGGCHAQIADLFCCLEDLCPSNLSCSACATQRAALSSCTETLSPDCFYIDAGEPRRCMP